MSVSLLTFLTTSSLFFLSAVSSLLSNTNFTWTPGSPSSCKTFVTYRVRSPYSNLGAISDLFGISRMAIATTTNLVSEDAPLASDRLLLIPIMCTSNGTRYFSNVTYEIKKGDTFYSLSTRAFQNLTEYHFVEDMNPTLTPNNLTIGAAVTFPLLCKCPGKLKQGIEYLITYVWQPGDDVLSVSTMFQASSSDLVLENNYGSNFTAATCLPVLIPVKKPILLQPFPFNRKLKHRHVLTAVVSSTTAFLVVLSVLMAVLHKKKKPSGFIPTFKIYKGNEAMDSKTIDKLLPGVSGYLGKPIVYDPSVIMKATMNLSEQCRIGPSVYKAIIDDRAFAVKKTRDAIEEVQILQKLNHANLVNLMGVSSDKEGNCYIVYEFVENGSLNKWLHPKVPSSSRCLTWEQRLLIALDVANGLQYLHEHTEPSIVHKDIGTGNVLLAPDFKAKIAGFSCARRASCSIMLNVDVFSFGVVLLELLSGKKVMEMKENGEAVLLWKEVKGVLDGEDGRKERLKEWMDPRLEESYPIEDALSLALLGRACTCEKPLERPTMAEIAFSLSVVVQSSPTMYDRAWDSRLFESSQAFHVGNAVMAR